MKPLENTRATMKNPQIITLGYAERPKKIVLNEQSSQQNIQQPMTDKENSRFMVQQTISACKGKPTKLFNCQAVKRLPLNMIVSKTATRKRSVESSSSDAQCEESTHPVERLFKSIKDPKKYKLEPPSWKTEPCRQPNKMDEIVNLMKEKCSQFETSLHSGQPVVKSENDPELRNIVVSALATKSNSRLDYNKFHEVNYNNYKAFYETRRPVESKWLQVLDEDPLGFEPTNSYQTPRNAVENNPLLNSSSTKHLANQTGFNLAVTSRGTQTQRRETDDYTDPSHYGQAGSSSSRIDLPPRSLCSSSETQRQKTHNYQDHGRADSSLTTSNPFRLNPKKNPFRLNPEKSLKIRSSSQMQWRETRNYQDESSCNQAGTSFATSTPYRSDPALASPRSTSWDSSSTSSGQTVAEERLQMTFYARRGKEPPANDYTSFNAPNHTGSTNKFIHPDKNIRSIFIKNKIPSILKFFEE